MTPVAIGRVVRALRHRKRWRQADLARRAGIGQAAVSRVERGDLAAVSVRTLGRLCAQLGGELVITVRWQGGDLDRLLDRAHAALVERVARLLAGLGWEVFVEVSFSKWGERGSIDVLGWHPMTRSALVVEVKSEVTGVEETLRRHDVKVRLVPAVLHERIGERPALVARLLVLPESSTSRDRIAAHAETFARVYPLRGRPVRAWLRRPSGPMAGILLVREAPGQRARRIDVARECLLPR